MTEENLIRTLVKFNLWRNGRIKFTLREDAEEYVKQNPDLVSSLPSEDSKEGHENETTCPHCLAGRETFEPDDWECPDCRGLKDGQAKGIPTDQEIKIEAEKYGDKFTDDPHAIAPESFFDGAHWFKKRLQENSRESRQEPSEGKNE